MASPRQNESKVQSYFLITIQNRFRERHLLFQTSTIFSEETKDSTVQVNSEIVGTNGKQDQQEEKKNRLCLQIILLYNIMILPVPVLNHISLMSI